jgi:hypothetical protein
MGFKFIFNILNQLKKPVNIFMTAEAPGNPLGQIS